MLKLIKTYEKVNIFYQFRHYYYILIIHRKHRETQVRFISESI